VAVRLGRQDVADSPIAAFELVLVTGADQNVEAARIARELERIRLYGFGADELLHTREPDPPPSSGVVREPRSCGKPMTRALAGLLPLSCRTVEEIERSVSNEITDEDINALAKSVDPRLAAFESNSYTRGRTTNATTDTIRIAIAAALAQPIARWDGLPPLMAHPPTPGHVVSSRKTSDGVELWLGNGAHVRFHAMPSNRITVDAASPGGALASSDPDVLAMETVAEMVGVAGLGEHDGVTTQRILDRQHIQLDTKIELRSERVHGEAPADAAELLFQSVYLAMTPVRVDAVAADAVRGEDDSESSRLARDRVPHHVLADLGVGGPIKPNAAHALELFHERFGNAGDFLFEVSGPLEPAKAIDLIAAYLGALPDDGRRESIAPIATIANRTEISIEATPGYSCGLSIFWTVPAQPIASQLDEAELWELLTLASVSPEILTWTERRDNMGYALRLQYSYDCKEPNPLGDAEIRSRLALAATHATTDSALAKIRAAYAKSKTEPHSDRARVAATITAADVVRIVTRFQPPKAVLIVREVP